MGDRKSCQTSSLSGFTSRLCIQVRIAIDASTMVRPVAIREMQQVSVEGNYCPIDGHRFMHEVSRPSRAPTVVKTDLSVGIPSGMSDPGSQVESASRH